MEKQEYQQNALEFYRKTYSNFGFEPKGDEFALERSDGMVLYLLSPYAKSQANNFETWEQDLKTFWKNGFEAAIAIDLPWDQVHQLILPQLKLQQQIDLIGQTMDKLEEDPLVQKNYIGELRILWVIDQPRGFVYITSKTLASYQKQIGDLEAIALENLRNLSGTIHGLKEIPMNNGSNSYIWETNDGYDAARILLKEVIDVLHTKLGETYYVGIPHRDVLLAVSEEYLDKLKEFILEHYNASSHPILPVPLRITTQDIEIVQ